MTSLPANISAGYIPNIINLIFIIPLDMKVDYSQHTVGGLNASIYTNGIKSNDRHLNSQTLQCTTHIQFWSQKVKYFIL